MTRPLPHATSDTEPFWDGCKTGDLRYQICSQCNHVQIFPRSLCSSCQNRSLQWKSSGKRGRVMSYTKVHRAPTPAFRNEVPYLIALVEMDEGFRLMVNVRDSASEITIGQAVRVGFREVDGVSLPEAEACA
jgi:uncharacterized OB-fold protein